MNDLNKDHHALNNEMMEKVLEVALFTPQAGGAWGLPLILEGGVGIGKSSKLASLATKHRMHFEKILIPSRAPEDFSGVLIPDGQGGASQTVFLKAVREILKRGNQPTVLLLDELNWAGKALQGALLGPFLDRLVGDVALPPSVRVIAAGNPVQDAEGGTVLIPPLANRLAWFDSQTPPVSEWGEYLRNPSPPPSPVAAQETEQKVLSNWARHWGNVLEVTLAYTKVIGNHQMPPKGNPQRNRAWPSPRSWEMAMRAAVTARILGYEDVVGDVVAGCVGRAAALGWVEAYQGLDLPDPATVLRARKWEATDRIDRDAAVYRSAVAYALQLDRELVLDRDGGSKPATSVANAWALLAHGIDGPRIDSCMPCVSMLLRAGFTADNGRLPPAAVEHARNALLRLGRSGLSRYAETS